MQSDPECLPILHRDGLLLGPSRHIWRIRRQSPGLLHENNYDGRPTMRKLVVVLFLTITAVELAGFGYALATQGLAGIVQTGLDRIVRACGGTNELIH